MHLLMLSHDTETLAAFRRSCSEMGIHLYVCEEARSAHRSIEGQRYDGVIIDCDDTHAGTAVLKAVRAARANHSAIVLAVLNGDTHAADAIDMGANLVVSKPVSGEQARHELRRVQALAGGDQRSCPRYSARGVAYVSFGRVIDRRAEITSLALGGMGLRLHEPIHDDDMVQVRLQLPGSGIIIHAQGEIVWSDPQGGVGVRFVSLSESSRAELERWLQLRPRSTVN